VRFKDSFLKIPGLRARARTSLYPSTSLQRIALATYAQLPGLNTDDGLLIPALRALGFAASPAVWDAPDVCWDEFAAVVVRSCWDYHRRLPEFRAWIAGLERARVALCNPPELLRWNSHKSYLRDLAAAGVPVVPTQWLVGGGGDRPGLAALLSARGWRDAVVKPAVSASAFGTWRTSPRIADADQSRLDALLDRGDVLLQPFVPEVHDPGEWSLVFFGRRFSHAVLKRPAGDDYRVQWEFGGTASAAAPPQRLIADAERVLGAVPGNVTYARVDGVERDGRLVLMELELIEPHLFLALDPGAAARLARAIAILPPWP
jgi:hypothetical protein